MELIANTVQTVQPNQDVLFTDVVICGNNSIQHRKGSGLVNLRGLTQCQCRARFKISFGGNIAMPADGTAAPIQLSLALDGEPLASTTMIFVPAAVGDFGNVFSAVFVDVPKGCCEQISVKNTSTVPIEVQNSNLIVERVA